MRRSDNEISESWNISYNESNESWQPWIKEAHTDLRMYLGDQFSAEELEYLKKQSRSAFVYNRTARNVNNLAGFQRGSRMGSACDPQEGSDQQTADIFSDLLNWQMVSGNGYNLLSDAFKYGSCITGLNFMSLSLNYLKDPVNGDIVFERCPYNALMIDPYWNGDFNMKSARYMMRRKMVSPLQAKGLLPEAKREIDQLKSGVIDEKYPFLPTPGNLDPKNLLVYDEYWERDQKMGKMLLDRMTGETRVWEGESDNLKQFLKVFPHILSVPIVQESVKLHIFVNSKLLYSGNDPWGLNDFPVVPVVGYHAPEFDDYRYRCQGIVRCMRDPQIDSNKMRSKFVDMINSTVASGWIAKNGAVDNPEDLKKTGQGATIIMSSNSNPATDLVQVSPRDLPQSWSIYADTITNDIDNLPGMNRENLGIETKGDVSGSAVKLRMAAGRTSVAELLDNLDLSQAVLGQKLITLIQKNWNPEKVQKISGKEPTGEFYQGDFGKYDCVVKQTDLTDTQRNLSYNQLLQARNQGISIPQKYLIEQMPIADKSGLLKAFEEQAQLDAQQQQKTAEDQVMQRELQHAKVVSDLSLAAERRSRMVADEALARNRLSNADLDRAKTLMEEIKAGKEMQAMDLNLLRGVLDYARQEQEYHAGQDRKEIEQATQRAYSQAEAGPNQTSAGQIPNQQELVGQ